jgi:hypothetical protein
MQTIEFSSSSSSSSDSEEERRHRIRKFATLVVASVSEASDTPVVRMRGGSRPGKAKNRDNGMAQGAMQIDRDYSPRPVPRGLNSALSDRACACCPVTAVVLAAGSDWAGAILSLSSLLVSIRWRKRHGIRRASSQCYSTQDSSANFCNAVVRARK